MASVENPIAGRMARVSRMRARLSTPASGPWPRWS